MHELKDGRSSHHEYRAFRSSLDDFANDEIRANEREHHLESLAVPERGYSEATLIHQLFDEQVQRTPHAIAVVCGHMSLTYFELNAKANQLARYLRDIGIRVDQTVGVCLERSVEMVVALLGVLKAGGAYVPLDPTYPSERLTYMVSDSAPKVILTSGDLRAKLPETSSQLVALNQEWSEIVQRSMEDLGAEAVGVQPGNLIYVIYTSGSTGVPKGAMNEHRAVANRLRWMQNQYHLNVRDRVLQKTPFSFDVSGWEFFWTLLNGATLVMARPEGHKDPSYLRQVIDESGVTRLHFVPSMLSSFLMQVHAGDCPSLRHVVCSGEELPESLQHKVFEHLPGVKLSNLYGPTEAAIDVTSWECRQHDTGGRVPIGYPITNVDIYVLNRDLQPVPLEVPGEIYIGGAGVGRGYMNRPALTAERFLVDPFSTDATARMYRTGDIGRLRPDGAIDYLGRNDFQVKIRGFRVELGEIEARLSGHPEVREAAVTVREDVPGDKRIVAYLIPDRSRLMALQTDSPETELVGQWRSLYEETYSEAAAGPSFVGWNSSYSGHPIPEEEMREWLGTTIDRIRSLHPTRVLEIGCGVGLFLELLAPQSSDYWATDISAAAIAGLRRWISAKPEFSHVQLHQCSALELAVPTEERFDTVVLNSVIQYFPNIDYLRELLKRAVSWVSSGGYLFLGDIRHLGLLRAFHGSVLLETASPETSVAALRGLVDQAADLERELVIDPQFFRNLTEEMPEISAVVVLPKRGTFHNELSIFRYDVIIRVSGPRAKHAADEQMHSAGTDLISEVRSRLEQERPASLRISAVRNSRVARALMALRLIEGSVSTETIETLRRRLSETPKDGEDPESFWALGKEFGYDTHVDWSSGDDEGRYDVEYVDRTRAWTDNGRLSHLDRSGSTNLLGPNASNAPERTYSTDPLARKLEQKLIATLRRQLELELPSYMVPNAFVVMQRFPLSANGKLDRRRLPLPGIGAYASVEFEKPRGPMEEVLADIWKELLRLDRVGRTDNFFALGGHSLLIIEMLEKLHRRGFRAEVRDAFSNPTLSSLAYALAESAVSTHTAPPNKIPSQSTAITPEMLPLVNLTQEHIDRIVQAIPGGARNIQDIYPLAPLQQGLLFHHLLDERHGDSYVLVILLSFSSIDRLSQFTSALQRVVDRHDVLRTAILWRQTPTPIQVVQHRAELPIIELVLDPNRDVVEQLKEHTRLERQRIELEQAPLMRVQVVSDPRGGECYGLLQWHHLIHDHESLDAMLEEVAASMTGVVSQQPDPVPYRNHVALALEYARTQSDAEFFRRKFGDITEPSAPFGLLEAHGRFRRVEESKIAVDSELASRIRFQARKLGVSAAALFHAAWGLVVAQTTDHRDAIFGTVLIGRRQASADARGSLGLFINTLPVRLALGNRKAKEFVLHAHREVTELLEHEFAALPTSVRSSGITTSAPLFTTLLNYYHGAPIPGKALINAPGVRLLEFKEWTNYPISMSVADSESSFHLMAQTDERIDSQRVVGYLATAVKSLVDVLERGSSIPVSCLTVMPSAERNLVIKEFNSTKTEYPQQRPIHGMFEEQVTLTPNTTAVIFGREILTYAGLNAKANRLAHILRSKGVSVGELVGICVERSLDMMVGLLGILKAGGAYVPMDPNYPPERLAYMLEDAAPKVLLTQEHLRSRFLGTAAEVLLLDADRSEVELQSVANPNAAALGLRSQHLAYVIYTSGSTGKPKGVTVQHCNLANLVSWHIQAFRLTVGSRTSSSAGFGFDATTWEIWPPLCSGGCLVLAPARASGDPQVLLGWWRNQTLDVSFLVTPLAELAYATGNFNSGVHTLLIGGDRLRSWPELLPPEQKLVNNYGPTEATVVATSGRLYRGDAVLHIGEPISNTRVYILDVEMQPVPLGVAGELYIGGAGVALGYLNRPDLTAERFLADSFGEHGDRLYRTGDLGRWRSDGTIEYLGRNDHQVKIRGFRIELEEIEAQLSRHPKVNEAVVLAREDVPGEKRLVGYVVGREVAPGAEELRGYLKGLLPEYMVPGAFMVLESLPLMANGKLDRRALPAPEESSYMRRQYEAPQGEVENILAGIWQELLRMDRVGRQDNFFEFGGHSLLIVQMLERLRRVGLSTQVRRVFDSPTLMDLAAELTRELVGHVEVPPNRIPEGCEKITPEMLPLVQLGEEHIERIVQSVPGGVTNIQDIYPLAPLQEGILFHHLLDDREEDPYARSMLLSLASRQEVQKLIEALQRVIDRHDVLRAAVHWEQLSQPVQVVYRQARLPVDQLELDADRDNLEQLRERMTSHRRLLDLRWAPLIRLQIAADPHSTQWYGLLQTHHFVFDGQSLDLLLGEVAAHMGGHAEGLPQAMPYREHIAQALQCARRHNAGAFFRDKLGDVDEPTAPYGLLEAHASGSQVEKAHERLDPALAQRARRQARELGVSAATLFHAAWGLVVAHTSARDDVVYGTVLLGRLLGSAGAQRILGMFINTLPLRLRLRGVTAKQLVESTQRELVDLLSYEQTSLAAAQRCSGVVGSAPLFTALLNYRHRLSKQGPLDGAAGIALLESQGATNYPITLSVDDLGDGFELTAETDRRIDSQRIVGYLTRAMRSLVEALEGSSPMPVLYLEILPELERDLLLEEFNAIREPYAQEKMIHGLFEEQADRTPDAVAVEYEAQLLSYAELNARANQLARYLTERGVGPNQLVGVCVERSLEMVIGLLGVLKAGGAYVPLDPNYPVDRLTYMLEDADPKVLLTQGRLNQKFSATRAERVMLDEGWREIARQPVGNLNIDASGLRPDHLAYVIYTSGSTGLPKGVMVEHANVVRLFAATREWFGFTERDVWTLFHSYAFDFSVWELWGGLLHGGRVVVVPYLMARASEEFYRFLCEREVTVLNQTPSAFKQLITAQERNLQYKHTLQVVIFGGEALELSSLRPWVERNGIQSPRLVNMYGITETTVHVTYRELEVADIAASGPSPIGVRIPDLRTYILNACLRPVPLGVSGELYVGGAGVARGYLNRADLMAERFIADPYSQEAGARLYRTGDLGRWRNDGVIEYLGRNDNQIKIRGFRIELGEIETQLRRHPRVKDALVVAQTDRADDKRLVAYVVLYSDGRAESPLTAGSLRAYLKEMLPQYMVPSAYVMLERFPLTTNGKLDRRSLPTPDLDSYVTRQYEAPQGEGEERLAQIWQELLRVERVGRHDSFFELGGHSLLALRAIYKINQAFDCALAGADLYRNSTLAEMAARINRGAIVEQFVDLQKEATLDQQIVPPVYSYDVSPKTVLVTGATGFVGRFLITQLLQNTDAALVCLVRAPSSLHALTRLKETLCQWKLWSDRFETRIVAIAADLSQPRLGITEQEYQTLCTQVDSIYDCATSMNHLETYAMAKASNVEGAREIVKLAARGKSKLINYISTLSVFRPTHGEVRRVVGERTSIDHEKHVTASGYTASKWVAEKIFTTARERGFRCNIFRLGLVWADTSQGRYDELQREYRLLQSCLKSGYGISGYDYECAPVPVDFVARAVVALAGRHPRGGGVFHVSSSRAVHGIFERINLTADTELELLPLYQWVGVIRRLHEAGCPLPVVPLVENLFALDEDSLRQYQLLEKRDVRVDCERTFRELENLGIVPHEWDDDLLSRFIENLRDRHPELREIPLRSRVDIDQRHCA